MDKREEILLKELRGGELPLPLYQPVYNAMDENGKRLCLELLEYMANHGVRITHNVKGQPIFEYKGEWISKEQLFENFL